MNKIVFFAVFFSVFSQARAPYNLEDLKILATEGSYKEFFDHALDVRPGLRDDSWKEMVSKMASSWGRKILDKSTIQRDEFTTIENLYNWPALKSDDVFKSIRAQVGLRYIKHCLSQKNISWDDFKLFWESDKKDPEVAFRLAEMTLGLSDAPYSTWTFLDIALKSPLSEFYCKKEFVMEALWSKIELDYIRLGPKGDLMKKIDQMVHPDCLPTLISKARERLYKPIKIQDRELSFQILASQGKSNLEITDFFYTVYLLENPAQGELFNYSWNRIRELGGTIKRRELVLEKLKSLDPLPDSIFSSLDQTKKRVVLNHLKTYFPEYLDFYTDQCISYYGGKGTFISGNPTVHCQEFMSSSLAPLIIDDFKIKKYFEIKKI